MDGHIKLADLGGISDSSSSITGQDDAPKSQYDRGILSVINSAYGNIAFIEDDNNLVNPKRRRSVMGTRG